MYKGPHITIHYDASRVTNDNALRDALLRMEWLIPGVTVWRRGDDGMRALRNRSDYRHLIVWATFPSHGAYLYNKLPAEDLALLHSAEERRSSKEAGFRWLPKIKPDSINRPEVAAGKTALKNLVKLGLVSQEQADKVSKRWYQLFVIGLAASGDSRWVRILMRIDGGGGKSATAIIAALAAGCRRILVVCPGHLRDPYIGWPKEFKLFTQVYPYVGWAASDARRAKQDWPTLLAYAGAQRVENKPAAAVYGYDLGDHLSEILAFKPDAIIIDEVHKLKGGKKFKHTIGDDGEGKFSRITTEVIGRKNRASALDEVCGGKEVAVILELTATAFDDGDPATVYGAISLMDDIGTKAAFLSRFKSGPPSDDAKYPQYADKSPSHVDELRARLKAWYLDVPSEITKEFIPRCIINPIRVPPSVLGAGRGYGITARQKALDKEARSWSVLDRENAGYEFELEVAAVKKYPAVRAAVIEALQDGQRVVVYVNRIEVAEYYYKALLADSDIPLETWHRCLHSKSEWHTGRAISEYSELSLDIPALIVGCVDSIGLGVNGLAETHLACYVQMTRNPTTVIQAKYRHERPKPRLGAVPTIFNVYIAEGTVDEQVETNFLAQGSAALALAKTEGLETMMEAIDASSLLSAEELAQSFKDGTFGEARDETGSGLGGGEWGGSGDDDEDVPF